MAFVPSNIQTLAWDPYSSAEFGVDALKLQCSLPTTPSVPLLSLRSIDVTAALHSRGLCDSASHPNDARTDDMHAQLLPAAVLETELVTPQQTPNSSLPQQGAVRATRTQQLWSRLRSRFMATPNNESLPALSQSHTEITATAAAFTSDPSHPSHFSPPIYEQSLRHCPLSSCDRECDSTRADHTVLYENPSIAYRAVDLMWDSATVVLHSARLRADNLDRRACKAFRRFFKPFVRFSTAYVSLHNGPRRLRTYDLPEANRCEIPAIEELAYATRHFDSQLRALPFRLDGTTVVECADEFRTALFNALAEANPQHDHRIVEFFASLRKAPTLLMMLAHSVSEKESVQREWVARILFPKSTKVDRVLCLSKKARLIGRAQKRVARQFRRAARKFRAGQAQGRRMPSKDRLDRNEYTIQWLRDRPMDWSWHWELNCAGSVV